MKRIILSGLVLVVLLAAGGYLVFNSVSQKGSSSIERWIGQQLQQIVNSYLNPKLSFDDLDYEYPATVSVTNMRLVADDPSKSGSTVDIIGCTSAVITLAEVPSVGKPIVIEKIILNQPLISAVAVEGDSKKFVGFSNLMKGGGITTQPQQRDEVKLSDRFQMRLIQINEGKILYDPRIPGTEAMVLDQINTSLDIQPTEAGWYKLNTTITRKPIFDLGVAGQLNLDNFSARDFALKLAASLSPDKLSYLPPQIQQQLKKYEVSGDLTAQIISTELPLMDPLKGNVDAEVKLQSANVTLGEYRIPVKSLDLAASMEKGALIVPTLKVEALQGSAQLHGASQLDANFDSEINLKVAGMMLQDLFTGRKEGEQPKLAGRLDADVNAKAPMKLVFAHVSREASSPTQPAEPLPAHWGGGKIRLSDGRLVQVPLIQRLADGITAAMNLVRHNSSSSRLTEKAAIDFAFKANNVEVTDMNYVGEVVGVRGKGTVSLDRKLDLLVNGGPVERVQQLLGEQIGGTIGMITDKLLAYRVTGTLGDPKVNVQVAGGSVGNVGRGVRGGAEQVGEGIGEGIQRIGEGIGNIFKPKDESK